MTKAVLIVAVYNSTASFPDKVLMVMMGLAIVVPTLFLVGAVLLSRRGDFDDHGNPNATEQPVDKPLVEDRKPAATKENEAT